MTVMQRAYIVPCLQICDQLLIMTWLLAPMRTLQVDALQKKLAEPFDAYAE